MQAFLPVAAGGLGLASAQLTSQPAYVASWIDYLWFVATNDSLFPSVLPLLTPNSLRTSTLQPIRELREAWQGLEDRLERPDPDRPGYVISGLKTLQELLGRLSSGRRSSPITMVVVERSVHIFFLDTFVFSFCFF